MSTGIPSGRRSSESGRADIAAEERPLVYIGYYDAVKYGSNTFQLPARDNYRNLMIDMAGGRGMGDEISGSGMPDVDTEWIITRNPDVIIFFGIDSVCRV